MLHSEDMSGREDNLRPIYLGEYREKFDDTENRVKASELGEVQFAEVYTTAPTLVQRETAITFLAEIQLLEDPAVLKEKGRIGIQLVVYSRQRLRPIEGAVRLAVARPERNLDEDDPVVWAIEQGWPFHIQDHPQIHKLRNGFLRHLGADVPQVPNQSPGEGF